MKKILLLYVGFTASFPLAVVADQNLAGNVTITGGAASGKLNVTGAIDSDSNTFTFGTQSASYGAALLYIDNAVDTLSFSINRSPASWLWVHNTNVAAMRLDSAHQLILYRDNGTTAGITLTPGTVASPTSTLSLGTATLSGTAGALAINGNMNFTGADGSLATGSTGVALSAVGANKNVSLIAPSGDLTFSAGGAERARIKSSGNVGIGVTNPLTKFDVRGASGTAGATIQIVGTGVSTLLLGQDSDGGIIRGQGGNSSLKFLIGGTADQGAGSSGTEAMRIVSSGNVGIGTSTPNYTLSFGPTLGKVFALFENNGTNLYGISAAGAGTGGDPYRLKLFSNGSEAMSLTSAGNVGIGTSTPYAKLAAVGNISAGSASSAAAGTNFASLTASATKSQLYLVRSIGSWSDTWWDWTHDNDNKLKLGFSTVPQAEFSNGTTSFFGTVGIGPAAPSAKLHVQRDGAVSTDYSLSQLFVGATDGNKRMAVAYDTVNNVGLIQAYVYGGSVQNIALQSAGGNVGIGTTAPGRKLEVADGSLPGIKLTHTTVGAFLMYVRNSGGNRQFSIFDETASTDRFIIDNLGNIGIGTTSPTHKLSVNGTIRAKEVIVDNTGWADYVFDENYALAPLSEVESHIKAKKHLPGIPSAAEIAEHGISMGDMQSKLLSKVEELTLHLIRIEKENGELRQRLQKLESITGNP